MPFTDDLIEVETPERVELSFPIAGLGSRFGALLFDIFVMGLIYVVLSILWVVMEMLFPGADKYYSSITTGVFLLAFFLVSTGYFIYFEYFWNGQTPGKRIAKLRVMKLGGLPVDLASAMIRNLMRTVDILLFGLTIGFFILFTSKYSQRPGDYVAGTIVVRDRDISLSDLEKYLIVKEEPKTKEYSSHDVRFNRLSDIDMRLINTFIDRQSQLELKQRQTTASNIANGIRVKTRIRSDEYETDEMLIRAAFEALRSRKGSW